MNRADRRRLERLGVRLDRGSALWGEQFLSNIRQMMKETQTFTEAATKDEISYNPALLTELIKLRDVLEESIERLRKGTDVEHRAAGDNDEALGLKTSP